MPEPPRNSRGPSGRFGLNISAFRSTYLMCSRTESKIVYNALSHARTSSKVDDRIVHNVRFSA